MKVVGIFAIVVLCAVASVSVAGDSSAVDVANANNQFTVDLYKKVNGETNVVASPFSVSTVLSMLLVGAKSATADEMKTALDYGKLSQDAINDGYKRIIPGLAGNYTLEVTNAIFVNKDFAVLQSFKDTLQSVYQSGEYELDVANGQTQINDFVKDHTRGKIPKLLDAKLPSDTEMVLVNAIYFKGAWKKKFDKKNSKQEPFTNADGSKTTTTLMHATDNLKYTASDTLGSQVLMIPYTGESMYMVFVLPNDATKPLSATESLLSGQALVDAVNSATNQNVIVTIPKYKIESTFNLNDPLIASGMKLAFTNSADFSGVSTQTRIKVSKVVQKAMIEVNEEGTEAAAATAVVTVKAAAVGVNERLPIVFTANRPFLYALYHKPTNSILFIGKYAKASA